MALSPDEMKFGRAKWRSRSLAVVASAALVLGVGLSAISAASATAIATKTINCYKLINNAVQSKKVHGVHPVCSNGWSKVKPKPAPLTSAKLSLQVNIPVGGALGPYIIDWINSVSAQSKGKIVITPYNQGQLYTNVTSVPAVQSGALDLNLIDMGTLDDTLPAFQAAILPLAGADDTQLEEWSGPTSPVWTALAKYASQESLVLFPTPALIPGNQSIMLKAPITSLAAFKGQSIRSLGGAFDTLLTGLGASPVDLSSSAVPTALETGTISGAFGSLSVMETTWKGLGNTDVNLGSVLPGEYYMVANKGVWSGLSVADRDFLQTTYEDEFLLAKPLIGAIQTNAEALWLSTTGNTVYNLSSADLAQLKPILTGIWSTYATAYPTYYSAAVMAVAKFKLGAFAPVS